MPPRAPLLRAAPPPRESLQHQSQHQSGHPDQSLADVLSRVRLRHLPGSVGFSIHCSASRSHSNQPNRSLVQYMIVRACKGVFIATRYTHCRQYQMVVQKGANVDSRAQHPGTGLLTSSPISALCQGLLPIKHGCKPGPIYCGQLRVAKPADLAQGPKAREQSELHLIPQGMRVQGLLNTDTSKHTLNTHYRTQCVQLVCATPIPPPTHTHSLTVCATYPRARPSPAAASEGRQLRRELHGLHLHQAPERPPRL